jgi:hypothetical protein
VLPFPAGPAPSDRRSATPARPWRARDAAEILAMLDMTDSLGQRIGRLDDCPVLPAALTAILEGRATTVSQTAFNFDSTAA